MMFHCVFSHPTMSNMCPHFSFPLLCIFIYFLCNFVVVGMFSKFYGNRIVVEAAFVKPTIVFLVHLSRHTCSMHAHAMMKSMVGMMNSGVGDTYL
jgi:hypothetical protein